MKERIPGGLSLIGLAAAYLLIRYPLFRMHGMKEWPLTLFLIGAAIIAVLGIAFRKKILSVLTFAGYLIGFFAGYLFQSSYGPEERGLNNMWIIWTGVYLAFLLAGCAAEGIAKRRKSPR